MPENEYSNGYGRTDANPTCDERPTTVKCDCCGGAGFHDTGAGMDASEYECYTCGGEGEYRVVLLDPEAEAKFLEAQGMAMDRGF